MEGVSRIKSHGTRGSEAGLLHPNRGTDPKKATGLSKRRQIESEKIEHVAQAMENYVKSIQRDLKIQVHSSTGNIMVKVISKESGQIIREIPPEELLNLAAKMEQMTGALFNENA